MKNSTTIKDINDMVRDKVKLFKSADVSQRSGIGPAYISNWRKGLDMSYNKLIEIADAFDYRIVTDVRIKI